MFKKTGILLSVVLTLLTAAEATVTRKNSITMKSAPHYSPSVQAIKSTPHTPLERYLLPTLQKRLATHGAQGKSAAKGGGNRCPRGDAELGRISEPSVLSDSPGIVLYQRSI